MPIPGDVGLTFRVRAPEVYERGEDHVSRLEARSGFNLVVLESATMRLRSPQGTTLGTYTATIGADGAASVTVPAADLPSTLAFGPGYVEEWDPAYDGTTYHARRDAYLARRALYCPVTSSDIIGDNPQLRTAISSAATSLDGWRDEVWADTLSRLRSAGTWPDRIVEVSSLSRYVRLACLHSVYLNLSVSQPGRYDLQVRTYSEQAERAFRDIRYGEDLDANGIVDDQTLRPVVPTSIHRGGARRMCSRLGRVLG